MKTNTSDQNHGNDTANKEVINDSNSRVQSSTSPPLSTTATSIAIREFCSTTSRYLNEFSFNASSKLERISRKIDDLDVQLQFLECKVNHKNVIDDEAKIQRLAHD